MKTDGSLYIIVKQHNSVDKSWQLLSSLMATVTLSVQLIQYTYYTINLYHYQIYKTPMTVRREDCTINFMRSSCFIPMQRIQDWRTTRMCPD